MGTLLTVSMFGLIFGGFIMALSIRAITWNQFSGFLGVGASGMLIVLATLIMIKAVWAL